LTASAIELYPTALENGKVCLCLVSIGKFAPLLRGGFASGTTKVAVDQFSIWGKKVLEQLLAPAWRDAPDPEEGPWGILVGHGTWKEPVEEAWVCSWNV
jgi:hypothetical protein